MSRFIRNYWKDNKITIALYKDNCLQCHCSLDIKYFKRQAKIRFISSSLSVLLDSLTIEKMLYLKNCDFYIMPALHPSRLNPRRAVFRKKL